MKRLATFLALALLFASPQIGYAQSFGHIGVQVGVTGSSLLDRGDGFSSRPGFLASVSARSHETGGLHIEIGIIQRAIGFDGGIWEGEGGPVPAMTFRSTYAYGATLLKIGHSFGRATPYFLTGLRTNFNLSGDDSSRPIMGLTAGVGVVVDGVLPTGTSLGLRVNQDLTSISTSFDVRYRFIEFRLGVEF